MENNKQYCDYHKEKWSELWEGQIMCESCYQEYHIGLERMIEAMAHKMVEQFQIEEGRVD